MAQKHQYVGVLKGSVSTTVLVRNDRTNQRSYAYQNSFRYTTCEQSNCKTGGTYLVLLLSPLFALDPEPLIAPHALLRWLSLAAEGVGESSCL
jgi:hypothetical protein